MTAFSGAAAALPTLPVGLTLTPEPVYPVRTAEQRDAVLALAARDEFKFACSNPFSDGMGDYTGPFSLLWYDVQDRLHATRFGKRGNVLSDVTAD